MFRISLRNRWSWMFSASILRRISWLRLPKDSPPYYVLR